MLSSDQESRRIAFASVRILRERQVKTTSAYAQDRKKTKTNEIMNESIHFRSCLLPAD